MAGDIKAAQATLASKVMGRPGVEGVAIGEKGGKPCLVVYVSSPAGQKLVPRAVGGFRVVLERGSRFRKL
jgi:hypothetical protein